MGVTPDHPFYFRIFHETNHPAIGAGLHLQRRVDALHLRADSMGETEWVQASNIGLHRETSGDMIDK
jgi:hypothetical protein